jgi:hypothetical protein
MEKLKKVGGKSASFIAGILDHIYRSFFSSSGCPITQSQLLSKHKPIKQDGCTHEDGHSGRANYVDAQVQHTGGLCEENIGSPECDDHPRQGMQKVRNLIPLHNSFRPQLGRHQRGITRNAGVELAQAGVN